MKQLRASDQQIILDKIFIPLFEHIGPIMISGNEWVKQYNKIKDKELSDMMYMDIQELNSNLEYEINNILDTLKTEPVFLRVGTRYFTFNYCNITLKSYGFIGRLVFHTKNCDCPGIFVDVKVKFTNKRNTPEFEVTLTELVS